MIREATQDEIKRQPLNCWVNSEIIVGAQLCCIGPFEYLYTYLNKYCYVSDIVEPCYEEEKYIQSIKEILHVGE